MSSVDDWQRILWHEGMYLLPQQFQQADRHAQRVLHRVAATLRPAFWGFTELELDEEALAGGRIGLRRLAGILPDGLVFDTAGGGLPAGRALPAEAEGCRVRLALPAQRPGLPDWSESGSHAGNATRFQRQEMALQDASPDGLEDQVALAVPNFHLLLDDEADAGLTSLPLVSLQRRDGAWRPAAAAPPVLLLGAWRPLVELAGRIRDFLLARSDEMRAQRQHRSGGMVEFSVSETALVMTTQAINASLPAVIEAAAEGRMHPQDLHRELARLAGSVATFAAHRPADLPAYRHEDPAAGLQQLFDVLRGSFGTATTTRYVPLRLQPVNDRIGSATLPEGLAEEARFFLAVRSGLSAEAVMQQIPVKLKLAAAGRIGGLVAKALRGIELNHLPVPPAEIPAQAEHHYFELQTSGAEWEQVVAGNAIAVYTPPDLAEVGLELLAVRG